MTSPIAIFAKQLRFSRERAMVTQVEMAALLNCTKQHYQKIECGKVNISASNLIILANFFGVSLDSLFERNAKNNDIKFVVLPPEIITLMLGESDEFNPFIGKNEVTVIELVQAITRPQKKDWEYPPPYDWWEIEGERILVKEINFLFKTKNGLAFSLNEVKDKLSPNMNDPHNNIRNSVYATADMQIYRFQKLTGTMHHETQGVKNC